MLAKKQSTEKQADKQGRTRGRPKLEDVAAIESALLDVALAEFAAHGYGGTSMARIVKAAGISKTTLYSRFSSKADLFLALIRLQMRRLSASTALQPTTGKLDLESGLKAYANAAIAFSERGVMLEVNRLIYSEAHRFPELAAAADEAAELGICQISDFIQQCAEADGKACRDPRSAAEVFIFMLRGWYAHNMLTNRDMTGARREQWVDAAVTTLVSSREDW